MKSKTKNEKYAVVFERGKKSFGAYVPDLPGCVAVGKTLTEVKRLIAEAIPLHIASLREDGLAVPGPTSTCEYVEAQVGTWQTARSRRVAAPVRDHSHPALKK